MLISDYFLGFRLGSRADTDYSRALPLEAMAEEWLTAFRRPPFKDTAPLREGQPLPAGSVPPGGATAARSIMLYI